MVVLHFTPSFEVITLFTKAAQSRQIALYAPEGSMISLHNSPYYSHNHGSALDLYPSTLEFGIPASSPVSGIVRSVQRFKSPTSKWFEAPPYEPLILIEVEDDPRFLIKILHLNPTVEENCRICVGDHLGTYLRSGYFHPWTDPHMHIEVRHCFDPIRARGGLPISLPDDFELTTSTVDRTCDMSGEFSLVKDEYALIELDSPLPRLGYYSGLAARVGDVFGILDCGIPYYNLGGLHFPSISRIRLPSVLKIDDNKIGLASRILKNSIVFEASRTNVEVNGISVLGLSLRLHIGNSRIIKIIPNLSSSFPFVEGERADISIRGAETHS